MAEAKSNQKSGGSTLPNILLSPASGNFMMVPPSNVPLSTVSDTGDQDTPKDDGYESSDNGWTNVACPQNLCFDELSSLSTVMSKDLLGDDDRYMSSLEQTLRSKLERQNKRKFLAKRCRYNIVLAHVKGGTLNAPNDVKLIREKMMEEWVSVETRETSIGMEYIYQVGESSDHFQVSILEALLSDSLIKHCETRLNEYLNRKMHIFQNGVDECVHVCVCLFSGATILENPNVLDQAFEEELGLMKRLNDLVSIIPVVSQIEMIETVKIPIIRSWMKNLLSKHVKVFDDWFGQYRSSIPEEDTGDGKMDPLEECPSPLIPGPDFNLFEQDLSVIQDISSSSGEAPFVPPAQATADVINRLRSQVLTCPLVVDVTSDFTMQDSRYKLPRFDSKPPTSCDFLRMVLIEGCSLVLMERTKTLFGRFADRRIRENARRQKFEQVHGLLVSGVILVAATMSLFRRG